MLRPVLLSALCLLLSAAIVFAPWFSWLMLLRGPVSTIASAVLQTLSEETWQAELSAQGALYGFPFRAQGDLLAEAHPEEELYALLAKTTLESSVGEGSARAILEDGKLKADVDLGFFSKSFEWDAAPYLQRFSEQAQKEGFVRRYVNLRGKIKWEALLSDLEESTGWALGEWLQEEELTPALKQTIKSLNDEAFLQEQFAYACENKNGALVYSFAITEAGVLAVLDLWQDAFADPERFDELRENIRLKELDKLNLRLSFAVQADRLSGLSFGLDTNLFRLEGNLVFAGKAVGFARDEVLFQTKKEEYGF